MTAVDLFAVLRAQGARLHTLSVERWLGPGEAGGENFAAAESIEGLYADGTEYSGGQVFVTGRFVFALSYDYVPTQSRVALPALFGGRVARVVLVEVGDGSGLPTPDHQEIGLL